MRFIILLVTLFSIFPSSTFASDKFEFDWLQWGTPVSAHIKALGPRLNEEYSLAEAKRVHGNDDYAYGSYTKYIDDIRFGVHPLFDNKTDKLVALQVAFIKMPSLQSHKKLCSCEDLERKVKDIITALTAKYDKKKEVIWESFNQGTSNSPDKSFATMKFYSTDTVVELDYVYKNPDAKAQSPASSFTCKLSLMYSRIPF